MRFDLAPANIKLTTFDLELTRAYSRAHRLARVGSTARQLDCIILGCLPSLGLIVVNVLAAAKDLLRRATR